MAQRSREEGEIGSESREEGDLPPVPPPRRALSSLFTCLGLLDDSEVEINDVLGEGDNITFIVRI